MNSQESYKYACSHLLYLLAGQSWSGEETGRLQHRARQVFHGLSPYYPTYLRQHLTDAHSLYFDVYLRTPLRAEIEVYSTPSAADDTDTVYLRLLVEGQYVLQQALAAHEVAGRLTWYYASLAR